MEERKSDVRIYLITGMFLACTIGGGVFLCVYIVLPESESVPWYPIAGITLVAIPWFFWFLIYLYRCLRPMDVQFDEHQNHGKGTGTPITAVASLSGAESPVHSPTGGQRHVHFGEAVVMGNGFGGGGQKQPNDDFAEKLSHHESKEEKAIPSLVMVESRENEMPLTLVGKS